MLRSRPFPILSSILALAILLGEGVSARPAHAVAGGIGDLFVTSDASNLTRAYTGMTGNYLGVFAPAVNATGFLGLHFGATNDRALVGAFGGGVDEYDANTGAYIKTYNPGGGAQWAGIYRPNGNVFIGSWNTQDVREYDGTTGAFIRVLFPMVDPADMEYGPNGHLYVCSYGSYKVIELDEVTGIPYNFINLPFGERANDVAFLPGGRILVTAMGMNQCYVFDSALNLINMFAGTGWQRPHGVVISPHTGNILIADGVTTQVHEFDPNTYAELNANFLTPGPNDKIVDVAFRPDHPTASAPSTWGRVKALWR